MSAIPVVPTTLATVIQQCGVACLQSGAEFARVPIIGRRETNIQNDIEAAVAALGACIYVFPGLPASFSVGAGAPYADKYRLRVRCIELDVLNTTLPNVHELVEFVVRRMWGQTWTAVEGMNELLPIEGQPVVEIEDPERTIYDVIWETSVGYLPRIAD